MLYFSHLPKGIAMTYSTILREEYLDKLELWRDKPVIKVVTGVRRCGKSTLFEQYRERLRLRGVNERQIVQVNLEELEFEGLTEYHALYEHLTERLCADGPTYVFIDEAQQCEGFEKAVDSLYVKEGVDVYITGSNARLLSSELATLLSGRYVEIDMLPFSFREFLAAKGCGIAGRGRDDLRALFDEYLRIGSFPAIGQFDDDATMVRSYLEGIYNTILVKDVSARKGINDMGVLESIVRFLCSNIGSPTSIKNVSDAINKSGRRISVNTVENYIDALIQSYFFYKANRFDIKGKQHLKTLSKYYIVDTGLRDMLLFGSSPDIGQLLENLVYLELLRRGNDISVGKFDQREVDFVARGTQGVAYYQVSATVLAPQTLERELAPLQRIPDNHPKYLLTLDEIGRGANHDGIIQLNVMDWL
jgi:predicted AAA+ superfamily ATPase